MKVIIDTGPLFALFNKSDQYHHWANKKLTTIKEPLVTCESVLSEAIFLMHRTGINTNNLFEFIKGGDLTVQAIFSNEENRTGIRSLINTYANLPCAFANACLVQMYETTDSDKVFTTDHHFAIYRTSEAKTLELISPHIE